MKSTAGTARPFFLPILIAFVLIAATLFRASHAEGLPVQNQAESKEKSIISAVKADPVFGGEKEETEWRYINPAQDAAQPDHPPSWISSLLDIIELLSRALRVLVWIAFTIFLSLLIYLAYRYRHMWMGSAKDRVKPPNFLFGLDVRPDSLPEDVVSAALQELAKGNTPGTLSLLYRAALVSLIHRSQLEFRAGHTEDDCLRLVLAAVDANCSGYFAELLDAWKLTAYAHEYPPEPVLEALCHRWGSFFSTIKASS